MNNGNKLHGRILSGTALIIIGALFLLDNYGILTFQLPSFIFEWEWILILIGLFLLATSKSKTIGTVLIAVGLFNLFPDLWPLIFVIIGVYLIMRGGDFHGFSKRNSDIANDDFIDEVSIFGGGSKMISSGNFKGGRITAVFGGSELTFINSKLAEGNNVLDIFALFGGSSLIVPKDWNVILKITPLFGGFADKRFKDPNEVLDPERVLIIKGLVIFGGGELKNY